MMRRRLIQAGLTVAALLAVPTVLLLFEHLLGAWQVRSRIRDLQARGEHLDVDRLRPPPPPAASNGMERLMATAEALEGSAHLLPPSLRLATPGRGIPASRLESWAGTGWTNVTWPMVDAWITANAARLAELQAALAEPVCRAHPDFSAGFNTPLPHLAKLKSATTTLSLLTAHFAHVGDFEGALASLRSLFRIESVLAHEPTTISQLLRRATAAIGFNRAWDVLHARPWTEDQLRRLQAVVPSTRFAEAMVRGHEGERALFLSSMNRLTARELHDMVDGEIFADPDDGSSIPGASGRLWEVAARLGDVRYHLFLFGWADQAKATYLEAMDRVLSAGRAAAAAQSRQAFVPRELDSLLRPVNGRAAFRTVFARGVIPALVKSVEKGFVTDAHRDLLKTEIALERYHRRHGRYPETIDRLVPEFLASMPIDAMDGQPLRYRLEAGGDFTLWSVGDDRLDDGGDPMPRSQELTDWWRSKDGVWPRPASESETRSWIESEAAKRAQRRARSSDQAPFRLSPEMLRRYGLTPPEPAAPAPEP